MVGNGNGRTTKTDVSKTRIAVLGLGHVGLPTALGLAELGWEVIGADSNPETIASLKAGKSWFYEPDLEPLLKKHLESGFFTPTEDVDGAMLVELRSTGRQTVFPPSVHPSRWRER